MLAVEWFACGVVEDAGSGVGANGYRPEHSDVTGQRSAHPVRVVVAQISGQRPTVHGLARAFGQLILDCLDRVFDAIGHGGLQCRRQAGRLKCLASLETQPLEAGKGLQLLMPISLLGEARVVEDQADPL
ncbi:hypothetical protein D3C87_1166200 [compost metagenome]